VRVSPDLGVASVYLSLLNAKKPEDLLEQVRDLGSTIRHHLGRRIRNQARIIPELRFFIDNTAEEAEKMEKLLASLNIPKESK
jgi:ribosome-binding factor A